ncbi:hypothetical protein Q4560_02440 [Celeribacter halophilus]|uniref:Uncharacterized protein n=1 Tax=Celeribacter halophilus TaxID=576117 RepID=A0AAW7Y1J1_9RHOB|nr:hypothetical protein [Celeribacter halophilus]MDO6459022.1 hypothetical protein [Celeribacter halophilus]MDO6722112.1 hypothetical protein [Celeribacter halophilus]
MDLQIRNFICVILNKKIVKLKAFVAGFYTPANTLPIQFTGDPHSGWPETGSVHRPNFGEEVRASLAQKTHREEFTCPKPI